MNYISRIIEPSIKEYLIPNKVVVLLGPRRVGKTVLLEQIMKELEEPLLFLSGEDYTSLSLLEERSIQNYRNLLGGKKILVIDEAQKIPHIGLKLKLMVDHIEGIKILVTGSSAFDIHNLTGEPLTGRKHTFHLFPLSESELDQVESMLEKPGNLLNRLVFGNYPELLNFPGNEQKAEYIRDMVNSYLMKDILAFDRVQNSDKIFDLLRLIAFQMGQEVSLQELGKQLGMSKNTVEKYLDLLSKVFVIHKLSGFSRNLRKEVNKKAKWYFFDNGIRNLLVGNLSPIANRDDIGALWENYMISERIKFQHYTRMLVYNYFWRTYDQQEIDWVEDRGGKLYGYELKWNPKRKVKTPVAWENAYPGSSFQVVHHKNYLEWINMGSSS